jgi:hypothetical protein
VQPAKEHDGTNDRVEGNAMEKVMWLVLGATVIVASLRAGGSNRARIVARVALGSLFLFFGAMVNAIYLVTDWDSFAAFGEMSQFAFRHRDGRRSIKHDPACRDGCDLASSTRHGAERGGSRIWGEAPRPQEEARHSRV